MFSIVRYIGHPQTVKMAAPPKYIGREEVMKLLDSAELLLELESAFGKYSSGKDGGVQQPMRSVISVDKHHG